MLNLRKFLEQKNERSICKKFNVSEREKTFLSNFDETDVVVLFLLSNVGNCSPYLVIVDNKITTN